MIDPPVSQEPHCLRTIVTVCRYCRRILLNGKWEIMEPAIADPTSIAFSEGICPTCRVKYLAKNTDEFGGQDPEPDWTGQSIIE